MASVRTITVYFSSFVVFIASWIESKLSQLAMKLMKKKWYTNWKTEYTDKFITVSLPNAEGIKSMTFKRNEINFWLMQIIDCALTELSKKK